MSSKAEKGSGVPDQVRDAGMWGAFPGAVRALDPGGGVFMERAMPRLIGDVVTEDSQ